MSRIDGTRTDGPVCPQCGARVRLVGIEAHPTASGAELHTYVCCECDGLQTAVIRRARKPRTAGISLRERS